MNCDLAAVHVDVRVAQASSARTSRSCAAYSSLPTRISDASSRCTTVASTFSRGSPRRAEVVGDAPPDRGQRLAEADEPVELHLLLQRPPVRVVAVLLAAHARRARWPAGARRPVGRSRRRSTRAGSPAALIRSIFAAVGDLAAAGVEVDEALARPPPAEAGLVVVDVPQATEATRWDAIGRSMPGSIDRKPRRRVGALRRRLRVRVASPTRSGREADGDPLVLGPLLLVREVAQHLLVGVGGRAAMLRGQSRGRARR